jgi:FtsZ-binding cell division protein ZapB
MSPREQEIDALASLEERINRAVEAVNYLRKEKETIAYQLETVMAERDAARKDAALAQAQAQKVAQELEDLRSERKQVRGRIEKLLGQMDLLNVT